MDNASTNYLTTLDENNKPMIDINYYKNIINDYIQAYMQERELTPAKITGNDLLAISKLIYNNVFIPTKNTFPQTASNIPYTQFNIQSLFNLYKDTCLLYKCVPSLYGFSLLTGIQEDTVKKYLTPSQLEIVNLRREMLRNELYNDKTGRIVLANNDASFGLEYEKKNITERETIRQGLAVGELPQF